MKCTKAMSIASKHGLLCALTLLVMLVCQFLPYWSCSDGTMLSVQTYVWFPDYHQDLTKSLEPLVDQFPCNHAVMVSLPLMLLCMVSLYLCLRKPGSRGSGILALLTGIFGLIAYAIDPVMRSGAGLWLHVAVLALIVLCSVRMLRAPQEAA